MLSQKHPGPWEVVWALKQGQVGLAFMDLLICDGNRIEGLRLRGA